MKSEIVKFDAPTWDAIYKGQSQDDFILFAEGLKIPSAQGPQLLGGCIAPFQRKAFETLANTLKAVRDGEMPPWKRFWIERTKKTSKDADLAIILIWLVAFTRRPLFIQVCASNQKQAGIVKRRAEALLHYNPWLAELVSIQQNKIYGPDRMGVVAIEATGSAGGAQGETPDLLILNELVHVDKWAVMEAHMNNAAGVPRGVVIISTNAGIKGSKAELWRKNAIKKPERWWTQFQVGAPWLSKADMDEAKERDPVGAEYARLWLGQWISGIGDAVGEDALDRCFRGDRGPILEAEPGWKYIAGLDLGINHDHSGTAVLGINTKLQRLTVAYFAAWEPSLENDKGVKEVDIEAVERGCRWVQKQFRPIWYGYDPAAGGSFLAQRLRKKGLKMREMTFGSPKNQTAMATAFVIAMKDSRLECYDDETGRLRRDFGKFNIEHKPPSKYKLVAVSDEFGHADVGTALVIPLPLAVELLGWGGFDMDSVLAWENEEEQDLSEDEVEDMPDELRDIYEMGGGDDDWDVPKRPGKKPEAW